MNFLKRLFGPPATITTYAPTVTVHLPPAKPKSEAPAPPPPPPPPSAPDDDEITLIDPVAKDEWSIGSPDRQQNLPWAMRKPAPNPDPKK